jgi:hypothetical protein
MMESQIDILDVDRSEREMNLKGNSVCIVLWAGKYGFRGSRECRGGRGGRRRTASTTDRGLSSVITGNANCQ